MVHPHSIVYPPQLWLWRRLSLPPPNAHLPALLDLTSTGRLKFYCLTVINSFILSVLCPGPNLQRCYVIPCKEGSITYRF